MSKKVKVANDTPPSDITERKQAEEELEFRRKDLEDIMQNVIDGIGVSDVQGKIIQANRALAEMHGYDSPDEVIGRPFFDFVAKEDLPRIAERFKEMMVKKEKTIKNIEMIGLKKDGSKFPEMINITNSWDKDGGFIGSFVVVHDITEHKQAEERERKLQQELIVASRLATVGEMAAGIAHEINNPLTGVVGFSDLLMKKDIPEDIRKDVEIIYDGAQRVASITSRMLTFARQRKPERTSVNINDIIKIALAMQPHEMESSNIKVTTQLATDIPLTFADASQLQQVFLNIILNAEMEMKLVHSGGNLTVKTERIDNTIRVSFKDDGPGILKKNLERIFDPFFTTREVGQGAGLGLFFHPDLFLLC